MDKETARQYSREHYQRNKEKYKAKGHNHEKAMRQMVIDLKDGQPCTDCGGSFPHYVLDYDHLDPADKEDCVGTMVARGLSKKRIVDEIAKCELVCANCHRIRTHA